MNTINNQGKQRNALLIPIIIVGTIAAILAIVLLIKIPQLHEVQEGLQLEKQALEQELTELGESYNNLKTENDTLNEQMLREQAKITTLLESMKEFRNNSYAEINRYKKEIGTLKGVLRSYIVQVDSLNKINSELRAENKEVKKQMDWVRERNTKLEKETSQLKDVVEKASILHAQEFTVTPIKSNGKRVDWKRCTQLRADFIVEKNITADRGSRTIYLRITKPDGTILCSDGKSTFRYQGAKVQYTAKRDIQYEGESIEVAIYCNNDGTLAKGVYKAEIFSNNEIMATCEFDFK